MSRVIKAKFDGYKINIKSINEKWWLDFYHNKKRIRKSTFLQDNDKNLEKIKSEIIPEIITALTGNTNIEYAIKSYTLDKFSKEYFEIYKDTVREHTFKRNREHYNNNIKPYFGNQVITAISPLSLEQWQNKLLKSYQPHSVQKFRSILFSIFDKALTNELIKVNPLSRIKSPLTVKRKFKKLDDTEDNDSITPFNKSELKMILDNTDDNLYYVIYFMIYTGIRPGELISLKWSDIDFEKKRIAVDKTTVNGKVGDVKTQSSVRYIDLLPQLEDKLYELEKLTGNYEHLFLSSHKKPFFSHDILNLRFKKLLIKIGIKERTLYNLRHTFASQMISNIQNGIDILWVSKMLGHKDVSITLKVYAKYIIEDDNQRIQVLNNIGKVYGKI
ncbi:MAG: site-specific integrase [Arcobacter sp.]|uniref:tyrosine-type recombinase/integrase n=1 Tax=Arcobacter sp. TaxID=1872629 RepID=UPI003C79157A